MGILGRWLSQSMNIALALLMAILAMQAPAFTREYASSLLQVAQDSRRDIEQRKASARQFYSITATGDDAFVAALKPFEPSNAQTLALSLDRSRTLQAAYARIDRTRPLLRPIMALRDAFQDEHGYKAAIWRTLAATYDVQVDLSFAAAAYGMAGLFAGSLLAQLLLALGRGAGKRLARRRGLQAAG